MRALGIVLAGGNSHRMKELSMTRAIAAMPIAGNYRSVDFVLSSMSNSHIQKVAVLTQYNARSLNEHLSSSKWWDFGRKQGGLYVFTPTVTPANSNWYRGTADSIYQNLQFLKRSHEPYVIVASGDCIYKLDYNKLLEYHIKKKADVTVVYKKMGKDESIERFGTIKMDQDSRIESFEEKPIVATSDKISCGIYVFRRRQLIEMLEEAAREDRYDLVKDVIIRYVGAKKIYGFPLESYWKNIASAEDYYSCNMDFLKEDMQDYFFRESPDIFSKVEDLAPAKYNAGATVRNSLVSGGTIINGTVEDSVIFQKVFIGNNSFIKNSIILNDVYIEDNVHIENCIVESRGTISANSYHKGENDIKIVLESKDRYTI